MKTKQLRVAGTKKYYYLIFLTWLCFGLVTQTGFSQNIMFDDFNYTGINDPALSAFNKWNIVDGVSGPPEGAVYSKNNIDFITDPANSNNKIMALKTTVNGQTKAVTHSRIESSFEYFEGTYASRVYLSDESFYSKDANIQTFFTIVSSALAQDGSKYSEMDIIEYMASDKWGISPDNRVGYTTSYHKYIAVPWTPWKVYDTQQRSLEGWHTFIATCTDGVHIKYYMDNLLLATHSVTDNQTQAGLSVYPRSNMHIAYANWIWNNVLGTGTNNRDNTFMTDWVLHYKNTELNLNQINDLVASYRTQGLKRRNLAGQTFIGDPDTNPNSTLGKATLFLDCSYSGTSVALAEGSYTMSQLTALGMPDDNLSSLKVESGYKATLYWDDNFTGASLEKTSDDTCLTDDGSWNDKMTSIIVSKISGGGSSQVIEAEDYTFMGGVQLEPCSEGGQNVGYIDPTDWMSYSDINFPTSGNYLIEYRVASAIGGGLLSADLNAGATVLGEVSIPNTGGWQNWITVSHVVNINAGTYPFGLYAGSGGWNINWIKITKQDNALVLSSNSKDFEETTPNVYPTLANNFIYVNGLDKESTFMLYDLSGKALLNVKSNLQKRSKINIESLKSGLYIYKIKVAGKSYSGKIVKQ